MRERLIRGFGAVGVTCAVIVPAALFAGWLPGVHDARRGYDTSAAAPQLDAPEVILDAAAVAASEGLPPQLVGIPVLSDHAVSDRSTLYAASATGFAEHMAALDAAGFDTVTMEEVEAYVRGDATDLPRRPIMLTFDDGANSVWTAADPILARHGYNALSYLITDAVTDGAPGYYLSEPTLDAMVESRRWEFGAHTHDQHRAVETREGEGPALINLAPKEAYRDWRARVEADLDRNIADVAAMTGTWPRSFAFPFSANAEPTNHPRIPEEVAGLVADRFALTFLAARLDRATAVREGWTPYALPRLTITRDLSAAGHLRLDALTLGAVSTDGEVRFSSPQFEWGDAVDLAETAQDATRARGRPSMADPIRSMKLLQ